MSPIFSILVLGFYWGFKYEIFVVWDVLIFIVVANVAEIFWIGRELTAHLIC